MRFLQCTAHPGRDTVTFPNTHKLIENDCTVDANLINSFAPNKTVVVGTSTRYYTELTMFRFWVSLYLTIQCDIMICRSDSNATCTMATCPNTRKRRAVDDVVDQDVEVMTSVTTFKVLEDPDYILYPYMSSSSLVFPRIFMLWVMTSFVAQWINI
ncbi:uncharacterized protein LOC123560169 [Mercenaria mercenaria]|uniref:uncharacterized protein LOC123560169 n=1 Tax=Mercenaria mercenaria TaxID=6596 RepID=UPI00234F156D|nr:uncharacterized protein LOC123560169 [Mercenaria mercenaria]